MTCSYLPRLFTVYRFFLSFGESKRSQMFIQSRLFMFFDKPFIESDENLQNIINCPYSCALAFMTNEPSMKSIIIVLFIFYLL